MMVALAQRPGISARQIGLRAGLKSSSGTFSTYLGKLRSNGWVDGSRDSMKLTEKGIEALGSYDPLPTGEALFHNWHSALGGGAARMLEALFLAHPGAMTKEQLGAAAGISHTSGTFSTYLGKLRALELVTGGSEIKATDEFFD